MKNILKKILSTLVSCFLVICTVICMIVTINTAQGKEPDVFGCRLFYIVSGSMEPTINTGSVVLVKKDDTYKLNDVITFASNESQIYGQPNTHRIVGVVEENGRVLYQTKGDANNIEDSSLTAIGSIYGKVIWHTGRLTWLGTFLGVLMTPSGFMMMVVVPIVIIAVYIFNDFKNALREEMEKTARESLDIDEKLKKMKEGE